MRKWLLPILMILLVATPVLAQRTAGGIRGTVTDASGAVIPGVTVTANQTETGFSQSQTTSERGGYVFGSLPLGAYTITVALDGFKTAVITDIELNVADILEVNATLELGEITEEVTTVASSIGVETIGGEVAGIMEGEQIRELPLNGNNFVQLTLLMPGVSAIDGFNTKNKGLLSGVDMSVSGSAVTNNMWTVDGANNNDVGSNRTILVYPSTDAIEEFKIHRNSYGAEFGGAAGGQINIVTRGGSNRWVGSFSYFKRDDGWNEPNFFLKQAAKANGTSAETEPLDREDIGFTLGGPIIKDKLHFFASTEVNDETRGIVRTAFVPTAAERVGDFSGAGISGCSGPTPVDPLTGQPFPGNPIPADRLSAAGMSFLALYPLPNITPVPGSCNNWLDAVSTPIEWAQKNLRFDYTVTDSTRLTFRYTEDDWTNNAPNGGAENGLWGDDPFPAVDANWEQPSYSIMGQLNSTIGGSAVNTVQFSATGNEITMTIGGDVALAQQIADNLPTLFPYEDKTQSGSGEPMTHPTWWGGGGYGALWNSAPWENRQDLRILKDDYQHVFGKHWLKVGANVSQNRKLEVGGGAGGAEAPQLWGGAGVDPWGFNNTGNVLGDFLLKDIYHGFYEPSHSPKPDVEWEDYEVYFQDSWELTPTMTLDLGVRYSLYKEPWTSNDEIAAFDPNVFDPALGNSPCNGLVLPESVFGLCAERGFAGGAAGNRSLVEDNKSNFAPRLGFAWDVFGTGRSALRAGIGQFYQRNRLNLILNLAGNPPFVAGRDGIRYLDTTEGAFFGDGYGVPGVGFDDTSTPYEVHWNVTWEQQIRQNTTLEIGYVGSRGVHLTRRYDFNQVLPGDKNGNGRDDRLDFAMAGIEFGADADAVRAALRPISVFGNGSIAMNSNDGKSEYHSLQTHFVTRFGRGSHFQASYTLSKSRANDPLTDSSSGMFPGSPVDLTQPDLSWGPSAIDRRHNFNASLIWNLPTLENQGTFMHHLFGNWQLGAVAYYSSGLPITVRSTFVNQLGVGPAGTGYNDNNLPNRVAGVGCRSSNSNAASYLNPGAFTLDGMQAGTIGSSGIGVCEGPDYFQIDLSLYKNIRFSDRFKAQLRLEFFNVLDEVNFYNVNATYNGDQATVDANGVISNAGPAGNFGFADRVRDPRQVQFGIKLTFD